MITITLNKKTAERLSKLLKEHCCTYNNEYNYDFEVIARYIELTLKDEVTGDC